MDQDKKVYVVPEIERREQLKEVSGQTTVSGTVE
jgi:hypothetical protein